MDNEQAKVDGEGSVDGELDLGAHPRIFGDLLSFLVLCTKELVNEAVLSIVELFEFPLVPLGVLDGHLLLGDIFTTVSAKVVRIRPVECVDGGSVRPINVGARVPRGGPDDLGFVGYVIRSGKEGTFGPSFVVCARDRSR